MLNPTRLIEIIRAAWEIHGFKTPVVILSRSLVYVYFLLFKRNAKFVLSGKKHEYAFHLLNATFRTERAVEIPIALESCGLSGEILEVGNVLNQYSSFPHEVVDKYERCPGVINEDIVTYSPGKQYDLIITISTLEHVGWDESPRNPQKLLSAIGNLKSLLRPGGTLIATVPLGYNAFLDDCIVNDRLDVSRVCFMKRVSRTNDWVETSKEDAMRHPYGSVYSFANAIAIIFHAA
jgi:SAM-dependent methyltransferase